MAISINGAVNRREFLFGSAAAVAVGRAWGQSLDPVKMRRIAVMTLSLNSVLKSARNPTGTDIMDFPDLVADKLGIHNLEMCIRDRSSAMETGWMSASTCATRGRGKAPRSRRRTWGRRRMLRSRWRRNRS